MTDILSFFRFKINSLRFKIRAIFFYHFFKSFKIQISSGFILKGGNGKKHFGKNLRIYNNVVFEIFDKNSELIIGNNCVLSYGVIVVCTKKITFGNDVWVGEYTSIRDSSHDFKVGTPIYKLQDIHGDINLGNNVWIGRGCVILHGVNIGDNAVVAANSVVNRSVPPNCLYGGVPARFIKYL